MVAKLKANSQWGFLAMNTNKVRYILLKDISSWNKMIANDQFIIHNVDIFESKLHNTTCLQVYYTIADEFTDNESKTNVALASFVTAYARLHLYEELLKLDKRVLYFDTDSIIYITKESDTYQPIIGNYLL